VGDTRSIDLDNNHSVYLIDQGNGLYTGWYFLIDGNIPLYTFTNTNLESIIRLGYEEKVLSDFSVGSQYNQEKVKELEHQTEVASVSSAPSGVTIDSDVVADHSDRMALTPEKCVSIYDHPEHPDQYIVVMRKSETEDKK